MTIKQNFGKVYSDHQLKNQENITVIDQQREMQKEYLKEVWAKVDHHYSKGTCARNGSCLCPVIKNEDGTLVNLGTYGQYDKTFYIVVITKRERLFNNTLRNYFIIRKSCPTPEYDQSVFRFEVPSEKLQYLWTLPDKETHRYLSENRMSVAKEEYQLLNFVLSDLDGTLLQVAKQLNGEKHDSIILEGN